MRIVRYGIQLALSFPNWDDAQAAMEAIGADEECLKIGATKLPDGSYGVAATMEEMPASDLIDIENYCRTRYAHAFVGADGAWAVMVQKC